MRAKTQVRLSLYERGIAEALVEHHGYTATDARMLVVDYIAVVRRLGGYEQAAYYADLLDQARRMNQQPSRWLAHIQGVEKGELMDGGMESEDGQYLQTR